MVYRHPDGSYRRYPHRESEEVLTPIPDRPGWFLSNKSPTPVYREPPKPAPDVCLAP